MSWIDRIKHREPRPPQTPQAPAAGQPTQDETSPAAAPQDDVTLGTPSAPASSSTVAGSAPSAPAPATPGNPSPNAPTPTSGSNVPTTISVDPSSGAPVSDAEKMAQAERLRERLHVIESVGRGLSGDYKMGLEAGDSWAYDFGTNTIIYRADDLQGKDEDYAIGVILQETGRRLYSVKPTAPEFTDNPALDFLHNAVEGPRVCNLQTSKYAGAKPFFQKVYTEDLLTKTEESIQQDLIKTITRNLVRMYTSQGMSEDQAKEKATKEAEVAVLKLKSPVPRHTQFALGMIYDWYTEGKGESPDWLRDKNAMRALLTCQNDFRDAMKLQRDIFETDLTPKEISEQAKRAEDIVVNKIWPVYKQLLEMDQKDLGQAMFDPTAQQGQPSDQSEQSQQGKQGKESQQNQQGQQGKESQQGDQGKESQNGKESQKPSEDGKSGKDGQEVNKEGEGAGKESSDGKGTGTAEKSDDPNQPKDGEAAKEGQEGGETAGKTKPNDDLDTSDGGKLDDGNLSDKERQQAEEILRDLDKEEANKVKSREQRDKESGANNNGAPSTSSDNRDSSQIDLPTLQDLLNKKAETEKTVEGLKSTYEKYYSQLAPLTDQMSGELRNILAENSDMKYIGDFRSGRKLDMRRAMQSSAKFERTGMYDENIWLRRNDPSKRDYDFVFVVDESGSMMEAEKWENLLKGLVMSTESLEQLKVNFSVLGFSDTPVIHKDFKDKYDESFRNQMLAQIETGTHEGTNDADAMSVVREMLAQRPADSQKVVIVITDGEGQEAELKAQVEEAQRAGIRVFGVGIGDGMKYVKEVYPDSLTVERVNDLPFALTDLIRERILEGLEEGQ